MKSAIPDIWNGPHGRIPAVFTAVTVTIGSLAGYAGGYPITWLVYPLILFTALLLAVRSPYPRRLFILLLISLTLLATLRYQKINHLYAENCIQTRFYPSLHAPLEDPVRITGRVTGFPEMTDSLIRFRMKTTAVTWKKRELACHGQIEVLIPVTDEMNASLYDLINPVPSSTVEVLGYWQPILTFMNPGTDQRILRYRLRGIHGRLKVRQPELVLLVQPADRPILKWIHTYRQTLARQLWQIHQNQPSPLVLGLTHALWLGDRALIPVSLHESLEQAGMLHVLAVSGLHVGLLALLLWFVLYRLFRLPRHLSYFLFIMGMGLYLITVGAPISAVRATVLIILYAMGRWFFLNIHPINLLAGVYTLFLLWNPLFLHDVGFQLTFALTAILIAVPPLLLNKNFTRRYLYPPIVSFVAWASSLPWSIGVFGILSLTAFIWNLVFWPFVIFMVGFSLLLPFILLVPSLKSVITFLFRVLEPLLEIWIHHGPDLNLDLRLPVHPPSGILAGAVLALLIFLSFRLSRLKWRWMVWILYIPVFLSIFHLVSSSQKQDELILVDVSQGDAIVLRSGHRAIIMDAGGFQTLEWDIGRWVVRPALLRLGIRHVDRVIMSHAHPDHSRGLSAIIRNFRPGVLYYPSGSWIPSWLKPSINESGIRVTPLKEGDRFEWQGWVFEVLNPPEGFIQNPATLNNGSLTLMARKNNTRILLTGDIERDTETRLAEVYGDKLEATILKLGHHGSQTSTIPLFQHLVRPRLAVCSAGRRNRYGVPHREVINRLKTHGTLVRCTDQYGQIRIRIGPRVLTIWTYVDPVWRTLPVHISMNASN